MHTLEAEVVVIGGGPAGLAAAASAMKRGVRVLIVEREKRLGGILNQCIHDGFGLIKFGKTLTGSEYASVYIDEVTTLKVPVLLNSTVVGLTAHRTVTVQSPSGMMKISAGAVVLSMGCRERTRGALSIPGSRPAGIYTAGVAQYLVNVQNIMVGKRIVILGSGDIGLIMARRFTLEGAEVVAVVEKLPYSSGLTRNIRQCLDDYGIPLLLSHTVTNIMGKQRVESVTIGKLDARGNVVRGSERRVPCDTLVLSVGLIPENELSLMAGVKLDPRTSGPLVDEKCQTSVPGVFACGNVLQVHDLVDNVSEEGEVAGCAAAEFVREGLLQGDHISVEAGTGVRYVVPWRVSGRHEVTLSLRVAEPGRDRRVVVRGSDGIIKQVRQMRVHPAEMVQLRLKPAELAGTHNITVELV